MRDAVQVQRRNNARHRSIVASPANALRTVTYFRRNFSFLFHPVPGLPPSPFPTVEREQRLSFFMIYVLGRDDVRQEETEFYSETQQLTLGIIKQSTLTLCTLVKISLKPELKADKMKFCPFHCSRVIPILLEF